MITTYNANNYAQQVFFDKAFAYLKAHGGSLTPEELTAGKFLSLDSYFAHMLDLVQVHPNFVLIPSDESPFEIDANSRSIKIPSDFIKCAGVTGDNMSEIITFTVDRYFDYVDLAETNVCVQWETPKDKGISHISLFDTDTISGKLRFGWPLTSALTKEAGNITFAVRFFVEKEVDQPDGSKKKNFVYLLNTLPAIIPIKAGLNVVGDSAIVESGMGDLFTKFVTNSQNPSFAMPKPVNFTVEVPDQAKIDENDTLVLTSQAIVADKGHVAYNWYFKDGVYDKTDISTPSVLIDPKNSEDAYEVGDVYEPVQGEIKNVYLKQYYKKTDDPMNEYVAVYPNADGKLVDGNGNSMDGVQLYERYTQLKIIPNTGIKNITGLYYVGASNYVGCDTISVKDTINVNGVPTKVEYEISGINHTPELRGNLCYVPTPAEVIIPEDKNLPVNMFINDVTGAHPNILPNVDGGLPERTFTWYKANSALELGTDGDWIKEGEFTQVAQGVDQYSHTTTTPGWYYVHVLSKLNRAEKEAESNICRIVEHTKAPAIKRVARTDYDPTTGFLGTEEIEILLPEDNKTAVGLEMDRGDTMRLSIELEEMNGLLESDLLTYEWYIIEPDKEARPLNDLDMDEAYDGTIKPNSSISSNFLDIYRLTEKAAYGYFCKITNTLAGESATLQTPTFLIT